VGVNVMASQKKKNIPGSLILTFVLIGAFAVLFAAPLLYLFMSVV
jgi:hypothetical protein